MPEPDEAKVSSPVLRGVGSREAPLLPGSDKERNNKWLGIVLSAALKIQKIRYDAHVVM
jgi:hypothetical protein